MTARTCVAIGCTSPVLARRLCLTHYRQLASTGQACSVPGCDHPRHAGGAVHRPRRVHVVPVREAGDWLSDRIPNARREVRI